MRISGRNSLSFSPPEERPSRPFRIVWEEASTEREALAQGGGEDPRRGWSTRPSSSPPGAEEPKAQTKGCRTRNYTPP